MAPKIKYLTNKDLLAEIHKSKNSYCTYTDLKYNQYDAIVPSLDKITKKLIKEIRTKKAEQQTKKKKQELKEGGAKPAEIEKLKPVKAKDIPIEEIVFRVMTYDHIPLDTERKRKARTESEKYVRLNFPPFKHYVLINEKPKEVGRSHWKGDFRKGNFSQEHGKISPLLATMFMRLVEKYSQRGNWRNYTYLDEMKSQALLQLSQIGLRFDESRSDNPFSYYTAAVANSFTRILNIEKRNQNIRDDILTMSGAAPSSTRQLENALSQQD
jgi:hypothetical protein